MAARKSKSPLEWKMDVITTANATPVNGRIALGLRDDQIAEIHKIDSMISIAAMGNTDDVVACSKMLSMDPDVIANPTVGANHEDLEIFLSHHFGQEIEVETSGIGVYSKKDDQKIHYYDPPVLVGTDIGQVVVGDASVACGFQTRVFFTRRKATASELNQILLKRR